MKKIYLALAFMLFLSGCATTSLQTSVKMTNSLFLLPVSQDKKIVFLNIKNTSGKTINIQDPLSESLAQKGYIITTDPAKATYILNANILYCDKKRENNAGTAGSVAGGIGASVGAYNTGSMTSTIGIGLLSAGIGALAGKLTEDVIWQMQVDIKIQELANHQVRTHKINSQGQASVSDSKTAGFLNSMSGGIHNDERHGNLNSNSQTAQSQEFLSNYIDSTTMIFAEAYKMRLTLEEAIPVLEESIANQISGLF